MTIVPMTAAHVAAIAAIEHACFSRPWSEAALADELHNPAALFLVAVDENGAVVGYVGAHCVLDESAITNVAVDAAYRRQGVAAALISELSSRAATRGVARITLEVRVSNTAAIALYERLGFVRDGVRPRFYDRPTEDAALYSLYITETRNEP